MMSLAYAHLTGLLKSDLTTIEIELNAALRALDRNDAVRARMAIAEAQRHAIEGQEREAQSRPARPTQKEKDRRSSRDR